MEPPMVFGQKLSRFHQLPRHQIQETQVEIRPSPVTQRSCLGQSLVELGKEWFLGWLGWLGWLGYHLIPAGRTWDGWDGDDMWLKQCHFYHPWLEMVGIPFIPAIAIKIKMVMTGGWSMKFVYPHYVCWFFQFANLHFLFFDEALRVIARTCFACIDKSRDPWQLRKNQWIQSWGNRNG